MLCMQETQVWSPPGSWTPLKAIPKYKDKSSPLTPPGSARWAPNKINCESKVHLKIAIVSKCMNELINNQLYTYKIPVIPPCLCFSIFLSLFQWYKKTFLVLFLGSGTKVVCNFLEERNKFAIYKKIPLSTPKFSWMRYFRWGSLGGLRRGLIPKKISIKQAEPSAMHGKVICRFNFVKSLRQSDLLVP